MIHAEQAFEQISGFQKEIWLELFYHEKLSETMLRQDEWRPAIEKHLSSVKRSNYKT